MNLKTISGITGTRNCEGEDLKKTHELCRDCGAVKSNRNDVITNFTCGHCINVALVTRKVFPSKSFMKFILPAGRLDVLYNYQYLVR